MIVLDAHIWVWWVHGDAQLSNAHHAYIQAHEAQGLGVSIISCWEVAKLVENIGSSFPARSPIGLIRPWLIQTFAFLISRRV